jgi:citrate lyase beta subunit
VPGTSIRKEQKPPGSPEAYKGFERQGSLFAFLDGKLIDIPVVKKAENILMRAKAAGLL